MCEKAATLVSANDDLNLLCYVWYATGYFRMGSSTGVRTYAPRDYAKSMESVSRLVQLCLDLADTHLDMETA